MPKHIAYCLVLSSLVCTSLFLAGMVSERSACGQIVGADPCCSCPPNLPALTIPSLRIPNDNSVVPGINPANSMPSAVHRTFSVPKVTREVEPLLRIILGELAEGKSPTANLNDISAFKLARQITMFWRTRNQLSLCGVFVTR